ncbi:MAG TPA: amidohydrolase family protein [Pseudolabrys sp.]|nr:amidohydrolase family protein [Pseudolabrys sp.]
MAHTISGRLLDISEREKHTCSGVELKIAGAAFSEIAVRQEHKSHDTLIMPPFSNAHDHVRGVRPISIGGFDLPLELWLIYMVKIPIADPYLVAAAALGRQALGGVGTVMIHYTRAQHPHALGDELQVVAKAATDIGVRVAIAVALRDQNPLGYGPSEQLLDGLDQADKDIIRGKLLSKPQTPEENVRFVDDLAAKIESPLVSVQYGPYGMEWCSRPLLELIAKKSAENGRRVHMHLVESRIQREYLDHIYPEGPVHYLDKIGLLSRRLSVAHGVWLRPDELELMAERGVTVSVNSSSNLSLRSGISPMRKMHEMGVPFAMGLDGFSVDDDDDAFRELRLNYLLHQGLALEEGVPLSKLLHCSCYGGRYSVSGIEPGRGIAAGEPADFMAIDYSKISGDVFMDIDEAALLVRRATSRHLKHLVVGGRTVVENGALTGVDLAGVHAEMNAQVRHGMPEFKTWQQAAGRFREKMKVYYSSGMHRCG